MAVELQPAWYLIKSSYLLARWTNIIHPPYTAWHLSYVGIGIALASTLRVDVALWTLLAFFLGMGVAAHCFDLLNGDPLKLGIPKKHLWVAGAGSLAGACAIGLGNILVGNVSPWLLIFIPLGALFAVGYGLEWPRLHGDWQFSAWWAVFPLLVAYFAQDLSWTWSLIPISLFAYLTAQAQRVLSTRVRYIRRRDQNAWAETHYGGIKRQKAQWLIEPEEGALRLLSFAMPILALTALIGGLR